MGRKTVEYKMTNAQNTIAAMLQSLAQHGWTCEHPNNWCHPIDVNGEPVKSLYCTGPLWSYAQAGIYLSPQGRVLLTEELWTIHKQDIDLQEFLRWLQMPEPPWNAVEKKEILSKQRNLFGDDE